MIGKSIIIIISKSWMLMNMWRGLLMLNLLPIRKSFKSMLEKGNLKKQGKKQDGCWKLLVEAVSVIFINCTTPLLSVQNVICAIISTATSQKIREFVNLVFNQKTTKRKNQELMNVNFVEQRDFYTFPWTNQATRIYFAR